MKYLNDINNAIKTLHYRYGKGDIKEIQRFGNGVIKITAKKYSCDPHVIKGHVITNGFKQTIKLYGHQMTVIII